MRLRLLFIASLGLGVWVGCNAILGNESAEYAPESSATPPPTVVPPGGGEGGIDDRDAAPVDAGACAQVNLAGDPRHCGRCFHDCLGGTCNDGQCQPFVVANDVGTLEAITVDATHVYWIKVGPGGLSGELRRAPLDGGAPEPLFSQSSIPSQEIAVHGGRVYFGHNTPGTSIVSCPVTGCDGGAPRLEVGGATDVSMVRVVGQRLYFVQPTEGEVASCVLPCQGGPVATVPDTAANPQRAAANVAGAVAWTLGTGTLVQVKPAGANTATNVEVDDLATGIVIADGVVYAQRQTRGPAYIEIGDGGPAVDLTTEVLTGSEEIAVDAEGIYFTEPAGGGVVTICPRSGCTTGVRRVRQQQGARGITTDATSIYWTRRDAVMRLAK